MTPLGAGSATAVDVATALANCPLFAGCSPEDRRWLIEQSRERRFARGQVLFLEGDPAEWLLVVLSGRLKVCVHSRHGDELILDTVGPGQAVGEMGVLAGARRSATVVALARSDCLVVGREALSELLERRPLVARDLLRTLASYVHRTSGTTADLVFLDLPRRVAKWLLVHASPESGLVGVTLTQQDLAASLGASRQRVSATLSDLERRGWVTRTRGGYRVREPAALAAFVGE